MKKLSIFLGIGLFLAISGCSNYEEYGKNILEIDKNGKIEETIQDTFEESYYSHEELMNSIQEEVTSYNDGSSANLVEFVESAVEEQKVTVLMKYASAADYAAFNHVGMYHGPISSFVESEYHAYVDMKDADGQEAPLSSIVASGEEYNVVALDVDCILEVSGKICYVSDGVEIISNKAANVTLDDEAVYAYIIYK